MNKDFWKNKKVFITGHTGFKGAWLCLWLHFLGAEIAGYSLPPNKKNLLFKKLNLKKRIKNIYGDICNLQKLKRSIKNFDPDIVFHLAAQPLVIDSYKRPIYTFNTNVIGTANLMNCCTKLSGLKTILIITSDKCYENINSNKKFKEDDKLGGDDPYSASKAACEILVNSFAKSFLNNIGVATVRSGNVIGGGDMAKNRLIPDIINSLLNKKNLTLRNPNSTRPWQHVFEALNGYILLAEKLTKNSKKFSGAWNFGPKKDNISVKDIVDKFSHTWGSKVEFKFKELKNYKEKKYLSLDSKKAYENLGWKNKMNINDSILQIVEWHKHAKGKKDINNFSLNQLKNYISLK